MFYWLPVVGVFLKHFSTQMISVSIVGQLRQGFGMLRFGTIIPSSCLQRQAGWKKPSLPSLAKQICWALWSTKLRGKRLALYTSVAIFCLVSRSLKHPRECVLQSWCVAVEFAQVSLQSKACYAVALGRKKQQRCREATWQWESLRKRKGVKKPGKPLIKMFGCREEWGFSRHSDSGTVCASTILNRFTSDGDL